MTYVLHPTSPAIIDGVHLTGSWSGPMVSSSAKETIRRKLLRGWKLENDVALGQTAKWGFNVYNFENCRLERVTVTGIDREHGGYFHTPRGSLTFVDCVVSDCGGNGVQIVYRDPESDVPGGWQLTGPHRFERCLISGCGQPRGYGRASFALSAFGRQEGDGTSPKLAWDCPLELVETMIVHLSPGYELRGGLLCQKRPKLVVIGGATRLVGSSDRSLWLVQDTPQVSVTGHDFEGQRFVDIDGSDHVVFKSCTGSVRRRIDGVVFGTVDQDLDWQR